MKLYCNRFDNAYFFTCRIIVEVCQSPVEIVLVTPEMNETPEFKAKRQHGFMPMLELDDGTMLFESAAIARYIANKSETHRGQVLGFNAFEQAQITSWVSYSFDNWQAKFPVSHNTYGMAYNMDAYNAGLKTCKERCKVMDKHLSGKTFMVGNRFTLADAALFVSLLGPFSLALDAGFRNAMPNVSAWFQRCAQ